MINSNSEPLVSVCIPSYNNEKYIEETIQSILNQTYSNFELIIIDDCSKDKTIDVIKKFKDKRIMVYENEVNLGMQGNWNKVLSYSNGEYIKLICGDDIIYPDCLKTQVTAFLSNTDKNISLVSAHRKLIKSNGKESFGSFYKFRPGFYTNLQALKYCVTFGTNLIGEPMAVLLKASIFKEKNIVLKSNDYLIDMEMYTRMLQYGNLLVLKDSLSAFRVYSTSKSGTLGFKHFKQFNEFTHQKYLADVFGIKWYHRLIGKIITFKITILRNIIIYFSKY